MARMISPEGIIGQIPEDQVTTAEAHGFRVMTDSDLQRMHNRSFLAQKFFEQKHPKMTSTRLPRGRGRW
jgi:hypothetical protein